MIQDLRRIGLKHRIKTSNESRKNMSKAQLLRYSKLSPEERQKTIDKVRKAAKARWDRIKSGGIIIDTGP